MQDFPAFPFTWGGGEQEKGMSFRDYAAVHILRNVLMDLKQDPMTYSEELAKFAAVCAYRQADALLAAREESHAAALRAERAK